jgi:5-methylthioadenosine/S-adenosylhomocysteine deaminase
MDNDDRVFEDGAVVLEGNRIIDVDKTEIINKKHKADKVIDARRKAILPGLINTHLHSWPTKGTGDELPLNQWLEVFVHPQHQALRPDEAYFGSLLSYADSIKAGTTCVLDMYRFMSRCADAAEEVGIRAVLAPIVSDADPFHEKIGDNEKLIRNRHGSANDRIQVWCGIDDSSGSSEELLRKSKEIAEKHDVGMHLHSNESIDDIELAKKHFGKRPIEFLYDLGITGKKTVLAHCVWLSSREVEILQKTRTSVAHCPVSNMKVADGIAPIPLLMKKAVNIGIGSDGTIESNSVDMFSVMKLTSLLHRVNEMDATIMSAKTVLRMATICGARALGLENELGSIELGKKADIVLVDLNKLHLTPILCGEFFNIYSHLVYAANGSDVETVMVDGRILMKNRVLKTVNEDYIVQKATEAARELVERSKIYRPKSLRIDM